MHNGLVFNCLLCLCVIVGFVWLYVCVFECCYVFGVLGLFLLYVCVCVVVCCGVVVLVFCWCGCCWCCCLCVWGWCVCLFVGGPPLTPPQGTAKAGVHPDLCAVSYLMRHMNAVAMESWHKCWISDLRVVGYIAFPARHILYFSNQVSVCQGQMLCFAYHFGSRPEHSA